MTLEQHLADSGGEAEIAVDLERRMRVEEVGVDATAPGGHALDVQPDRAEKIAHQEMGVVAVQKPRPEVNLPAQRPTGAIAAAQFQSPARSGGAFGRGG